MNDGRRPRTWAIRAAAAQRLPDGGGLTGMLPWLGVPRDAVHVPTDRVRLGYQ